MHPTGTDVQCRTGKQHGQGVVYRPKGAFTLIELLVVMGIMVLMMGIGVTGYYGIRRGAEMRGAVSTIRTTLMLARQQAVTKRRTVTVTFLSTNTVPGTTSFLMRVTEKGNGSTQVPVHSDAYLPAGIQFEGGAVPDPIVFYPSGRSGGAPFNDVTVEEKVAQAGGAIQRARVRVWMLTGVTKVTEL